MHPWLSIIGLGEDAAPPPAALALIEQAEVLAGSERLLARIPDNGGERLCWSRPLSSVVERVIAQRGRSTAILATGDPMWYGIGATFARHVASAEMHIIPAPSAFSLACARLGWGLGDCETLSLHGRPLELLHAVLYPGARLLLLGEDGATPARVARLLSGRGYGPSRMSVLEFMGGAHERRVDGVAEAWNGSGGETVDFHTIAVECAAAPGAALLGRTPGLPDTAFRHDGQLSKQTVRAVTLARLQPLPRHYLWDVGAGCGSIGIEWMRAAHGASASAIEREPQRVALISANALALGAPQLHVVGGDAPAALDGLEAPDAVFIGGGLGEIGGRLSTARLLERCWQTLKPGGRLVANSVTLEGEQQLVAWHGANGGALERIAVSHSDALGRFRGFRPAMAVTQLSAVKS